MMNVNILKFGEIGTVVGNPVIYCNGICANHANPDQQKNLLEQVGVLATAFGDREVEVFNNPTDLMEYFSRQPAQLEAENQIAEQFAHFIRSKIREIPANSAEGTVHKVELFAHSHGALVTKKALEQLSEEERQQVNVHAFGGVAMIPSALAHQVHNYVCKGDWICRNGNKKNDSQGILERVIRIEERAQLEGVDKARALFLQFRDELYQQLDPSSDGYDHEDASARDAKIQRYFTTFWSGNSDCVEGFEEEFEKYQSCFNDYNITVYNSSKTPDAESSDPKQEIANYGNRVNIMCHILPVFKDAINRIAADVKAKDLALISA